MTHGQIKKSTRGVPTTEFGGVFSKPTISGGATLVSSGEENDHSKDILTDEDLIGEHRIMRLSVGELRSIIKNALGA
jgi:hypothetical protein